MVLPAALVLLQEFIHPVLRFVVRIGNECVLHNAFQQSFKINSKNSLVKQIFLGEGAAIAYDQQEATPTVAWSGLVRTVSPAFVSRV